MGLSGIRLYNKIIVPFNRAYKNKAKQTKKFIEDHQAIALPLNTQDTLMEYFPNAEDIHAIGRIPQEYFSHLYELPFGQGYSLDTESVRLPVCIRPYAIRSLIWSD